MKQKLAILVVAVLTMLFVAWPVVAQNVPCYMQQGGRKWVAGLFAGNGCEWEMQSGATLDVQAGVTETHANNPTFSGAPSFSGGLTLSNGDLTVADDLVISKQTSITVTNSAAFTPTGTYQPITAAGTVTPTITVPAAGTVIILVNTSSQTINLADTGTAKLTAAFAMGQNDSLTLLSDGTNVVELARANN